MVQMRSKKEKSKNGYLDAFRGVATQSAFSKAEWLTKIREEALAHFEGSGFPTQKEEAWKYTNLDALEKIDFQHPSELGDVKVDRQKLESLRPCKLDWHRLVFVNGLYRKDLSSLAKFPKGVQVGSIKELFSSQVNVIKKYLFKSVPVTQSGFTALNAAFLEDGAFVYVPDGVDLDEPIELIFLSHAPKTNVLSQPRNLIVVGKKSRVAVVENYVSLNDEVYLTNVVTEGVLEEGAKLDSLLIQKEGRSATQVSTTQVDVGRDATYSSAVVDVGGKLVRHNLRVDLRAEGARCILNGLYLTSHGQHVDNHTFVNHPKPGCRSEQLYKGVLDGHSKAVFSGKIFVHENAQKTDAHQTNKNLILSERASVDTKPQLEIFADDVKCTHGAAVGQLDEEAVFYLKSRGVEDAKARKILSYGFANEVLQRIKVPSVHAQLNEMLLHRLEG